MEPEVTVEKSNVSGLVYMTWTDRNGLLHREDGPAKITFSRKGLLSSMYWKHGRQHREGGPWIYIREGSPIIGEWALNGIIFALEEDYEQEYKKLLINKCLF